MSIAGFCRYIVIEINERDRSDKDVLVLNPASLYNAIIERVQRLHGDFGVAAIRSGFTSKYCNEKTRIAVIRSRHGPHRLVASCLPLITTIEEKGVDINTLYTGATIRQCFRFIVKYQQNKFDEFCSELQTDEEKIAMKKMLNFDSVLEIS